MAFYYFPSCKATAQFQEASNTESNATLAHKRYVEQFPHMFTPMEPEEQAAHFRRHCEQVKTEKVVCYCKFCTDAVTMGGKQGFHLLELLFPSWV